MKFDFELLKKLSCRKSPGTYLILGIVAFLGMLCFILIIAGLALFIDLKSEKKPISGEGSGGLSSQIPEPYNTIFSQAGYNGNKWKVQPAFLAAIFNIEHGQPQEYKSGYNPISPPDHAWPEKSPGHPENVTKWKSSPKKALGPMQFMIGTWEGYKQDGNADGKKDVQNIWDASYGAAHLLDNLGAGGDTTDEKKLIEAAAHYNGGNSPPAYSYEVYAKTVLENYHKYQSPVIAGKCGQSIIAQAKKYAGIAWGGHCGTKNTIGPEGVTELDCSGYVSRVYNDLGLIPNATNGCLSTYIISDSPDLKEITASEVQTGDIIVSYNPNHACIYVSGDVTRKFTVWQSGGDGKNVHESLRDNRKNQRYFRAKKCE